MEPLGGRGNSLPGSLTLVVHWLRCAAFGQVVPCGLPPSAPSLSFSLVSPSALSGVLFARLACPLSVPRLFFVSVCLVFCLSLSLSCVPLVSVGLVWLGELWFVSFACCCVGRVSLAVFLLLVRGR